MEKIFIACPANVTTGGPELLHQLCYTLRKLKYDAIMYYYNFDKNKYTVPIAEAYKVYDNPFVIDFEDSIKNLIIIPEVEYNILKSIKLAKKVFWWLSVDNYCCSRSGIWGKVLFRLGFSRLDGYKYKKLLGFVNEKFLFSDEVIHFVQSKYAEEFCKSLGIKASKIYYLSDYLNPIFINNAINKRKYIKKEDIVLYNPKKGYEFTKKIIEKSPYIKWIALENLSRNEMSDLLLKSKVYIDFGNHPGKDRIPREAAISGCCIITGLKGSAKYYEDVPIDNKYKIKDSKKNIIEIINKIQDIFNDFEENALNFEEYRKFILNEKHIFNQNVEDIFNKIMTD